LAISRLRPAVCLQSYDNLGSKAKSSILVLKSAFVSSSGIPFSIIGDVLAQDWLMEGDTAGSARETFATQQRHVTAAATYTMLAHMRRD